MSSDQNDDSDFNSTSALPAANLSLLYDSDLSVDHGSAHLHYNQHLPVDLVQHSPSFPEPSAPQLPHSSELSRIAKEVGAALESSDEDTQRNAEGTFPYYTLFFCSFKVVTSS